MVVRLTRAVGVAVRIIQPPLHDSRVGVAVLRGGPGAADLQADLHRRQLRHLVAERRRFGSDASGPGSKDEASAPSMLRERERQETKLNAPGGRASQPAPGLESGPRRSSSSGSRAHRGVVAPVEQHRRAVLTDRRHPAELGRCAAGDLDGGAPRTETIQQRHHCKASGTSTMSRLCVITESKQQEQGCAFGFQVQDNSQQQLVRHELRPRKSDCPSFAQIYR